MSTRTAFCVLPLLTLCVACVGSESESLTQGVGELRQPLDDACMELPADAAGDVLAILSSSEPLDPTQPQRYGTTGCNGVIFEFANTDAEPLHGAWVQAGGVSHDDSDALSESLCPSRELQAQYWGYKDNEWQQLAAADESATFAQDAQADEARCDLDALLLHEGSFEKLRVVARVTQQAQTYPMVACVW